MNQCKHQNTCPYAQPMFVGHDNPRFKYSAFGYCSPICNLSHCDDYEEEHDIPEIPDIPEVRQLKYQVGQAEAGYLHLQRIINDHLTKSKNKDRI